ncbi:MAG: adenosylcobalamin-dependent ribonucleoside-diphosphate reductase [Nanoarchaeota archaeon]|nr:adenosylcobalamin-dependent ribonucleoside-diphosphate reductase [Nanoarchaeota archaeon]
MQIFDTSFHAIVQGGRRAGANMAILDVSHPDIEEFITMKSDSSKMTNFNLSVAVSKEFMRAVIEEKNFDLINPRNKKIKKTVQARELFDLLAAQAWKTGDPGLIFIDEMNETYPFKDAGVFCTGACGQYALEHFEGVPYAHINLSKMISEREEKISLDKEKLSSTVHTVVHFLDNCIDAHRYVHPDIEAKTKASRKIGLGVMGFADLLFSLQIPYGSKECIDLIDEIMTCIKTESRTASNSLAKKRGVFPRFKESKWSEPMRNATLTSLAPTGTTSLLASASQSIEPVYALSFTNKTSDGQEFTILNKAFKEAVDGLSMDRTAKIQLQFVDSVQNISWLPKDFKDTFKTAMDISPEDHLTVMATFQKYVDNAISKTINLPNKATVDEVKDIMLAAYKKRCKGITIYRDGCRSDQVLGTKTQTRLYAFEDEEK